MPTVTSELPAPFEGRRLGSPLSAGDLGEPSPELRVALDNFAAGRLPASGVLGALVTARLLVPVVATVDEREITAGGVARDKQSSMATVLVESPRDRQRMLLAFTSLATLHRWQSDARPAPLAGPLVARVARGEGATALHVDCSGPTPFVVPYPELLQLGAAARPANDADDPLVADLVAWHLQGEPGIVMAVVDAGPNRPTTLSLVSDGQTAEVEFPALAEKLLADAALRHLVGNFQVQLRRATTRDDQPPGRLVYHAMIRN